MLGHLIHAIGIPGFIQAGEYTSRFSGQQLHVRTSPRYTIVTAAGVEFFFLRESGRFDGTGGMSLDSALSDCKVGSPPEDSKEVN